jgi:rubrerythrin
MKFNSSESIMALKNAMKKEKSAEEFYTKKAAELNEPAVKKIFSDLAEDERAHFELVSDLARQAEAGDEESVSLPDPTDAKMRVEGTLGKFKGTAIPDLDENTTVKEALTFALEIERISFNGYSQAAEDSEDAEVAAIYRYLAAEENKHFIIIDNTLDFIDDQDRWIYDENNLVFNL